MGSGDRSLFGVSVGGLAAIALAMVLVVVRGEIAQAGPRVSLEQRLVAVALAGQMAIRLARHAA